MIEETKKAIESRQLVLKLYDRWVRQRQSRPGIEIPASEDALKKLGLKNYINQLVEPRRSHLKQLKDVAKGMTTADIVSLLVMLELPVLETSALLHRLSRQLAEDPEATYFSKVNQNENCGSGCG